MMRGNLFVVAAPSGAGKTSLVAALVARDQNVRVSVSYTTRKPRSREIDGQDYFFVSADEFEAMQKRGAFLEFATVHRNLYGTSREWVTEAQLHGADVVLEIDCQGAAQVKREIPEAIAIFVLPPSREALKSRLEARAQDTPEVIEQRLAAARAEVRQVSDFDYVIINDDFERAARDLHCIVQAARLATAMQLERHSELIQLLQE
jgi:guanylate kinase